MPVKIAITGGGGFLAAHLLRHLQQSNNPTSASSSIEEIRTIDRKQFRPQLFEFEQSSCSGSSNIVTVPAIVHHCCDLLDSVKLEQALEGVDLVVHLARKSLEYLFNRDQKVLNERYSRDNLEATRSLLDTMFKCSVPRLVFVGDAFANLPPADNFGNSEEVHAALPDKFLLGHYGETRAKAELLGRERVGKTMPNGQKFHALFLRPTFVYGEGDKRLPLALRNGGGALSELAGPSNGLLQYMYAGSLAAVMAESMELLLSERAERYSGAFFYCMDDTACVKFSEFCVPMLKAMGHNPLPILNRSQWWTRQLKQQIEEWIRSVTGWEPTEPAISTIALQFLFGYAIGFADRKMALILKYRPDQNAKAQWMERTTEWIRREIGRDEQEDGKDGKGTEIRQMG